MFSRLGGPSPSRVVFFFPLFLSLFSRACIRVPLYVPPFTLPCSLLRPRSLGMAMSVLHFQYLVGPYPQDVGNVYFIFLLRVIALCMMHVYIYACMCVGDHAHIWLHKQPSLAMSAPNLCGMSMCSRHLLQVHIHVILYHSHRGVTLLIHVTK